MGASILELSDKTFDYVVIGGGTAGLTLAARLAEDPNVTVAVLEAGPENLNDPLINVPAQFGRQLGNPKYDWAFMTEPQKHSNNQRYSWSRGKTLGGSSAINFYAWSKPPAVDIDMWEKLGNPGWNWKRFEEYAKKVEGFTAPKEELRLRYRQLYEHESHGYSGPVKTIFPELLIAAEVPFHETIQNLGIPMAKDPFNGDPIGTFMSTVNLDPKTFTRCYAATAFYVPNKDKSNFKVLCEALVRRLLTKGTDGNLVATGVEFEYGGKIQTVHARKEVLICAGALKSPQILELSGIGDSHVLRPLGIETKIDLAGVGANAQEHSYLPVNFELDPKNEIETLDKLQDPEYAAAQMKLHAEQKGIFRLGIGSVTFTPLKTVTSSPSVAKAMITQQRLRVEANAANYPPGLKEQYDLQLKILESERGGDAEIICFPGFFASPHGKPAEPGKAYVCIFAATNHPFSRGTVHITSTDINVQPSMDPHSFEEDFDLQLHTEVVKFIRRLITTEPFKSIVVKEVTPGPEIQTDEQVRNYIKDNMGTTFHTAGTAAMRPRDKNGVVDSQLKVYGTKNIRVVDLSIVPLHIAAHTQACVYAIAEAAADIIKGKI